MLCLYGSYDKYLPFSSLIQKPNLPPNLIDFSKGLNIKFYALSILIIILKREEKENWLSFKKNILKNFKVERNVLIIVSELTDNLILATRNLNNVLLLEANEVNVLDLVSANLVIVEEAAIKKIEEALA